MSLDAIISLIESINIHSLARGSASSFDLFLLDFDVLAILTRQAKKIGCHNALCQVSLRTP